MLRVHQLELFDVLNAFHPLLLHFGDVVVGIVEALENFLMTCFVGSVLLGKVVEDVAYTQTVTAGLVRVGGADTLTCRTYLILTLGSLIGSIKQTVGRHDEVCFL